MNQQLLEVKGISKSYAGVQALYRVGMAIGKSEIHCLVGENGSGKSTLIKIIAGVERQDEGEIILNGSRYQHLHAIDSIREGIQVIYQDLALFSNLTVAENISLNQMVEQNNKIVNWSDVKEVAEKAMSEIEEKLELNERVENISMANKQIVAICRALTQNARLIIMDEPTSALTKEEIDHLFSVITRLKNKGISTLFVSHKLSEVFQIAENVTILRDGKKVGDYRTGELDHDKLVYLMTGKKVEEVGFSYQDSSQKKVLLEVRALTKQGQFRDISFKLKEGEVLGITGLLGSGRTEMVLSIFGLNQLDSGEIYIEGKKVHINSPQDAVNMGISYLPEDRLSQGLFLEQSIGDNIVVTTMKKILNKIGLINIEKKQKAVRKGIKDLDIRTPSPQVPARSLSGGNQQRVVLAKWLATKPKIFILDGPTIGIDIASKSTIHSIIRELARSGMGIIIISDEMNEVLQNCNRILVMREGVIIEEIDDTDSVSEEQLFDIVSGKELQRV
ncbi:MAG: sugar ABC transporter ATP-binding protein [Spirochaetota bacterium]